MASVSHTGPGISIPIDTESFECSYLDSYEKGLQLTFRKVCPTPGIWRLLACLANPTNSSILSTFIQKLNLLFDTVLSETAAETFSSQREKVWRKYHCFHCTTIRDLWDEFLRDQLGIKDNNSPLIQTVVQ